MVLQCYATQIFAVCVLVSDHKKTISCEQQIYVKTWTKIEHGNS